jgi:hypothetical protein
LLQLEEANLRVHNVSADRFELFVRALDNFDANPGASFHHSHQVIRSFLVALNVSSFGCFYWADEPWVHPTLHQSEGIGGPVRGLSALIARPEKPDFDLRDLTAQEVQNAIIIFGVLAREKTLHLESEYAKGILLLRMGFCELTFRREAFLCFYRALENFITGRILKTDKLENELRDLQRGLTSVGTSQEVMDEFKEIYRIRSSQVAHAQLESREITLEEVLKIKVFVDFIVHKTLKAQGVQMLEANRRTNALKANSGKTGA